MQTGAVVKSETGLIRLCIEPSMAELTWYHGQEGDAVFHNEES